MPVNDTQTPSEVPNPTVDFRNKRRTVYLLEREVCYGYEPFIVDEWGPDVAAVYKGLVYFKEGCVDEILIFEEDDLGFYGFGTPLRPNNVWTCCLCVGVEAKDQRAARDKLRNLTNRLLADEMVGDNDYPKQIIGGTDIFVGCAEDREKG